MEFKVADMAKFELSSRGTVFESGEEIQLLHHAIEEAAYDSVN